MSGTYIPDELKEKVNNPEFPILYETLDETIFHATRHNEKPVKTLQCIICKSTQFNVGQTEYTTAIRCVNCGWEDEIHTG